MPVTAIAFEGFGKTDTLSLRLESLPPAIDWLAPGRYRFEIQLAGSNCEPVVRWIDLHMTGRWSDDPQDMLSNGVVLDVRESA